MSSLPPNCCFECHEQKSRAQTAREAQRSYTGKFLEPVLKKARKPKRRSTSEAAEEIKAVGRMGEA